MPDEITLNALSKIEELELLEAYLTKENINNLIKVGIQDILTTKNSYKNNVKKQKTLFENSIINDFNVIINYCQEASIDKNYCDDRDLINGFKREYCHFYSFLITYIQNKELEDIKEVLINRLNKFIIHHQCKTLK